MEMELESDEAWELSVCPAEANDTMVPVLISVVCKQLGLLLNLGYTTEIWLPSTLTWLF